MIPPIIVPGEGSGGAANAQTVNIDIAIAIIRTTARTFFILVFIV